MDERTRLLPSHPEGQNLRPRSSQRKESKKTKGDSGMDKKEAALKKLEAHRKDWRSLVEFLKTNVDKGLSDKQVEFTTE